MTRYEIKPGQTIGHYEISNPNIEKEGGAHVILINMPSELLSLHESIGIEEIAAQTMKEIPNTTISLIDTKLELMKRGKIDTDAIAHRIKDIADKEQRPIIVGIGMPIGSFEYTQSVLIKLEQDPPINPMTIVLGNSLATYTDQRYIQAKFPYAHVVVGDGEEKMVEIVRTISERGNLVDSREYQLADLDRYVPPIRATTADVIQLGGTAKIEAGRGCDHGACLFCSRLIHGGGDYRTIPPQTILASLRDVVVGHNATRFEFTDEETFGNIDATRQLVHEWEKSDIPRVPFTISIRTDTLLALEEAGLLDRIKALGLAKCFVGIEGGSDSYLKMLGKKQTVEQINRAQKILKEKKIDYEGGFITFSWRMTFDQLRENIVFLSTNENHKVVSWLFNNLKIRSGSLEEKVMRAFVKIGKLTGYNPDEHYSINQSEYDNVPFLDPKVQYVYEQSKAYTDEEFSLFYAVRSFVRAHSLPEKYHQQLIDVQNAFKLLQLRFLQSLVGVNTDGAAREERKKLVRELIPLCETCQYPGMDNLKREIDAFLQKETRQEEKGNPSTRFPFLLRDRQGSVLLVRRKNEEIWGLPNGSMQPGENVIEVGSRELQKVLGINLSDVKVSLHTRDESSVFTARVDGAVVKIHGTDADVADILWLSNQDVLNKRVVVEPSVSRFLYG